MNEELDAALKATDLRDVLEIKQGVGEEWIDPFQKALQDYLNRAQANRTNRKLSPEFKKIVDASQRREKAEGDERREQALSAILRTILDLTVAKKIENAGEKQFIPKAPSSPRSLAAEEVRREADSATKRRIANNYRKLGYDIAEEDIVLDGSGDTFTLRNNPKGYMKRLLIEPTVVNIPSTFNKQGGA